MRRKKIPEKNIFRDVLMLNPNDVPYNYMKYLGKMNTYAKERYNLKNKHVELMFFVYEVEFFTSNYISKQFGGHIYSINQYLKELEELGMVQLIYDPRKTNLDRVDYMLRSENRRNHKKKYSMTARGRLVVNNMYKIANQSYIR
jgi:hypothetical protein